MKRVALLIFLMTTSVLAHDAKRPELNGWFESLRSGKGPCCSDADGTVLMDNEWESVNDPGKPDIHYRVMIDNAWVDVPDAAVLSQPNLYGQTMVWPIRGYLGTSVRCFIPGPGI